MPAFNRERATLILLDALAVGDKKAAAKWKITERTIYNFRKRLEADTEFSAFFNAARSKQTQDWGTVRIRFLRTAIAKLEELIANAKPDQIRDVAQAVKTVGELQVMLDALNPDEPGRTVPSAIAPQDAGNGSGGAGEAPSVH